jgi:hypothetical protein
VEADARTTGGTTYQIFLVSSFFLKVEIYIKLVMNRKQKENNFFALAEIQLADYENVWSVVACFGSKYKL